MDTENHSPLYWTVDTIYNNKIDNIEVYFFDAKGKPHFGTLCNESYTLTVKDKEGNEHTWSVFRDDRHRFYNPSHPDFQRILRTLKANDVIATLHYQKSLIAHNPKALELIETIAEIVGEDTINKSKRMLRSCGAGGRDSHEFERVVKALEKGDE